MTSMRIGIDYTAALRQGAGIGRYTRELVRALLELDGGHEYVLLAANGGARQSSDVRPTEKAPGVGHWRSEAGAHAGVRVVRLPLSDRKMAILWHRLRLPLWVELFCGSLDLFHSPDFALPPTRRARTVLTVHDLSFMRVPGCYPPQLRAYLLQAVPASVRRANRVLADSECTRQDVIELLGAEADRVEVVYPGVEARFQPVEESRALDAVRRQYKLPARFVLGLSTLQPRKNFERLIEAFAMMAPSVKGRAGLVIAGGRGWMYESIFQRAMDLDVADAVCFPGYVADRDLPALYSLADLFVFPSLYEGFGLEPLEAMACGTPVVSSHASSLPEVVGDAAVLFDPLDVPGLAAAIERVLSNADLRSEMVQRGRARARGFTWSAAATKLLEVYRELGSGSRGAD